MVQTGVISHRERIMWTPAVYRRPSQGCRSFTPMRALFNNAKALSATSFANDTTGDQGSNGKAWHIPCVFINVQSISHVQTFIKKQRRMFSLLHVSGKINWPGKCEAIIWSMLMVKCSDAPCSHTSSCFCGSIPSAKSMLSFHKVGRVIEGKIVWKNM